MRFLITILLLFPTSLFAQEYVKDGDRLKAVYTKIDETVYTVEQIKAELVRIKETARVQTEAINKQAEMESAKQKALLEEALGVGVISREQLDTITHELRGEVHGVNWTDGDI